MRPFGSRAVALVCCLTVVSTWPVSASGASPRHVIEQARSGALTAELSYTDTLQTQSYSYNGKKTTYTTHDYADFRLRLLRSGQLVFSRLLNCTGCSPAGSLGAATTAVAAVRSPPDDRLPGCTARSLHGRRALLLLDRPARDDTDRGWDDRADVGRPRATASKISTTTESQNSSPPTTASPTPSPTRRLRLPAQDPEAGRHPSR